MLKENNQKVLACAAAATLLVAGGIYLTRRKTAPSTEPVQAAEDFSRNWTDADMDKNQVLTKE